MGQYSTRELHNLRFHYKHEHTQLHKKRIANDPEFAYIYDDIEEYREIKDRTYISLVEKERLAEKNEQENKELVRANARLKRMGKEPIESIDDLPEELEEVDPFLDEAAYITLTLFKLKSMQLIRRNAYF